MPLFFAREFLLGILLGIFFIRHFIWQLDILLGIRHFFRHFVLLGIFYVTGKNERRNEKNE